MDSLPNFSLKVFLTLLIVLTGSFSHSDTNLCDTLIYEGPADKPNIMMIMEIINDKSEHGQLVVCKFNPTIEKFSEFFGGFPLAKNIRYKFTYDSNSKKLYTFVDIYVIKIHENGTREEVKINDDTSLIKMHSIEFDWIESTAFNHMNNQVYISFSHSYSIGIMNLEEPEVGVHKLFNPTAEDEPLLNLVALYPRKNLAFFTTETIDNDIIRTNLDGSGNVTILTRNHTRIISLVVDEYDDKLYWVEDYNKIYFSNLDGSNITLLDFHSDGYVEVYMVDQVYLYFSKYIRKSDSYELFRRINKDTGEIDQEFSVKTKNSTANYVLLQIVPLGDD